MRTAQERGRDAPAPGFTMIEVLIGLVVFVLAALLGSAFIARTAQEVDWSRDELFAREKAIAILSELQAKVRSDDMERAADLDVLDDGGTHVPTLTITTTTVEGQPLPVLVPPDHPISRNQRDRGVWRWSRSISVVSFGAQRSRDRRLCTVRVFRHHPDDADPGGTYMAEASGVVQSLEDVHTAKQVLDLYVIAIENVPAFWTSADELTTLVTTAIKDVQQRNPGLLFRVHWVRKMGFGRDEEYAPYGNSTWRTTDPIPLAYFYPGRLPDGEVHRLVYSVNTMGGRFNLDFKDKPALRNGPEAPEIFYDANGNGRLDGGEEYEDDNGNDRWDPGNLYPYAMADAHNHAMRYPDAVAKFRARVEAGNETEATPTWRLLLDRMVAEPNRYKNALILNTHGGLLPMPPVRNYSDPASSPDVRAGWRVVTHPERLVPRRMAGDDANSDAPRFRIYAFKASFETDEQTMTLPEPVVDKDASGGWSDGDDFEDLNGNNRYDPGLPITLVLPGGDLATGANVDGADTLVLRCLGGGVDADMNGTPEPYDTAWRRAPRLPEPFSDLDGDGSCAIAEPYLDLDGSAGWDPAEPFVDLDGNGTCRSTGEPYQDMNANGRRDLDRPAEVFDDKNGNGRWDDREPYWDYDGNGKWTQPAAPKVPPDPWNPAWFGDPAATAAYVGANGEPFIDSDGDGQYDNAAEPYRDANKNGRYDDGFRPGDLFFTATYDADAGRNVIKLYGTPLETPPDGAGRGLDPKWRLYDYDYVPCPTPAAPDAADRFGRDLSVPGAAFPKNTARWTLEIPLTTLRRVFESAPGANDGDAADRLLTVETRIGHDLTTGVMWPVPDDPQNYSIPAWAVSDPRYETAPVWPFPRDPQNRSATYAYFHASPDTVPFSERYQFQGDPRHSPYADCDATGTAFPHGYNWYFDDLRIDGVDETLQPTGLWGAYDWSRLSAGWAGQVDCDVPRFLDWLRTGIARAGAVYTHLSGASFTHLSLGGDIASLENEKVVGVPVSGIPYNVDGLLDANTLADEGSGASRGSRTYLRANNEDLGGLRSGGTWWAKPWIGELFPDRAYWEQWAWFGNLRAEVGTKADRFHHMLREDAPVDQLPHGMQELALARGELGPLGVTAFFNVGGPLGTLRQDHDDGTAILLDDGLDVLVEDGEDVGQEYGFSIPKILEMSHPFGLARTDGDKTNGVLDPPAWSYPALFPRWSATRATRYLADKKKPDVDTGGATLRHADPTGSHHGRVGLMAVARDLEGGDTLLARFAVLTLLNSFGKEGLPGVPGRIPQLPRIQFEQPVSGLTLVDPPSLTIRWRLDWRRWDGRKYNRAFADDFAEDEGDIVYVLMASRDYGETWRNLLDGSWAFEGQLPLLADGTPDPARTVCDTAQGGEQSWTWSLPVEQYPAGAYVVRVEAYHAGKPLHYAYRTERVDVER